MTIGGVDAAKLRSFIERIEQADAESKYLNELKASIYNEAEPEFDKNALKQVVKRRRKERNIVEAEDQAVAVYERALASWRSTPLGEYSEAAQ